MCRITRTRFGAIQVTIRDKMQCDKKSLLAETDTPKKTEPDDGWNLERLEMVWICVEKTILNALGRDGLY